MRCNQQIEAILIALGEDVGLCQLDIQYLVNRYQNEGVNFLTKTLPLFSKTLLNSIESCTPFSVPGFLQSRNGKYPYFLYAFVKQIFESSLNDLRASALKKVRQICEFFYKLVMPFTDDQIEKNTQSFLSNEQEVAKFNERGFKLGDYLLPIKLFSEILQGYESNKSALLERDGPGATFEGEHNRGLSKRYDKTYSFLVGPDAYCFSEWSFDDHIHRDRVRLNSDQPFGLSHSLFAPGLTSRITFVPKDSRGPRVIAIEPSINQFRQQGIMRQVCPLIERNTNYRINFESSLVNGTLAKAGSIPGNKIFTFDLKDASDLVPVSILLLFPKGFTRDVLSCRSTHTEIHGNRILLQKVASMGSACCFPILAMVTYVAAVDFLMHKFGNICNWTERVFVYGDDLIINLNGLDVALSKEDMANHIRERFNLRLNVGKSFTNTLIPFRESCGVDALFGFDVKPILLRKFFGFSDLDEDEILVSVLETSNLLFSSKLFRVSGFLLSLVEDKIGKLPVGNDSTPYLHKIATTEFHPEESFLSGIKTRKSSNSFRCQFKVPFVKALYTAIDETYSAWFSTQHSTFGTGKSREPCRVSRRGFKIQHRWVTPHNGISKSNWLPDR